MLYKRFLEKLDHCPFCRDRQRSLVDRKTAYLTYALAPYSRYHLLVVPKRHTSHFLNLTKAEEEDIDALLKIGSKMFEKLDITDWTVLVREGRKQKSIKHLHYHLIPNHRIGDLDAHGRHRRVLSGEEVGLLVAKLSKLV